MLPKKIINLLFISIKEKIMFSHCFFFYHMIDPLVNEFFSLIVLESMFMFKGELYEPIQLIAKQY